MKEKIAILSSFRHPELPPESKRPALRVDCLLGDYDGETQFNEDVCYPLVFTNCVKDIKRFSFKYRKLYTKESETIIQCHHNIK